jgi:hypothetical protein
LNVEINLSGIWMILQPFIDHGFGVLAGIGDGFLVTYTPAENSGTG